jgi:hypothetical protein
MFGTLKEIPAQAELGRGTLESLTSPVILHHIGTENRQKPVVPKSCQAPWTTQFLPNRSFNGRNKSQNLAGLPPRIC